MPKCCECGKKISVVIALNCTNCSKKYCFNCLPYEAHGCSNLADVISCRRAELENKLLSERAIPVKIDKI